MDRIGVKDMRTREETAACSRPGETSGFLIIEDDKILDCNSRLLEIFDCSSEKEILGNKFYGLAPEHQPDGRESFELYREMVDDAHLRGNRSFVFQFRSCSDKPIWAEVSFSVKDFEGKAVLGAVIREAADGECMEGRNGRREPKYDNIFNNGHTPMLIIESESGEIRDANQAACAYYGYTREALLELKITDINILSQQEVFKEMELAKSENRRYFRFRHRLSDGNIKEVEVYSGPIKQDGELLLFSIIHDVHEKKEMEERIRIQESYFKSLYENSPEAIVILDNEYKVININGSFEKMFQYGLDEIRNESITKLICGEEFYDESAYFKDSINKGEFVRQETLRRSKDGRLIDVSFLGYPVISGGEQIGVFGIYSDLSKVKEIESKKKLFSEIFRYNTVGVVVTDIEGNIQWINDAFTEITGYSPGDVEGKKPSVLKSGKHNTEYYSNMWNAILNTGKWQGEIWNRRKNGQLYQEWLSIIAVNDDKGNTEYFVGMLNDITDAKQKENRIEILTNKDGLTDLYNRDYFVNKLNYEILKRNGSYNIDKDFSILFLDLDDFKEINDTLGHLTGDIVLKEFASRLKGCVQENGIAARFGGDEFIVLLPIRDHHQVINIAKRILDEISRPFVIDGLELHITASLGIARYPNDGTDSTTLIRNADIAMYQSKEIKSKKITVFEASLDEEVKEYFKIKSNLRNAIANNELFLEYQPIMDVAKNRMVGAEALLRWNYNSAELIPPLKFIPIAEKNGYMQSIGEWVLNKACEQNSLWQRQGFEPIFVSVNVSIIQLEQPNFHEIVERVLERSGLDPACLELEITETIFTKSYDRIIRTIKELSGLGVKMAIDDFGTGYSSLGQLSKLEIGKLKIDKTFISGINESENQSKIVKAIISLAQSMNLELIAEGVEKEEQVEFLLKNNCNMVQGFLYSKPLSSKDMERLLLRN